MTTPHELIAKWRAEAKDWIDNAQAPEFEIHGERLIACADELSAALAQPQPAPEQQDAARLDPSGADGFSHPAPSIQPQPAPDALPRVIVDAVLSYRVAYDADKVARQRDKDHLWQYVAHTHLMAAENLLHELIGETDLTQPAPDALREALEQMTYWLSRRQFVGNPIALSEARRLIQQARAALGEESAE